MINDEMKRVPIITYHSVSNEIGGELGPYTLTPRLFNEHMAYLRDEGYVTYSISGLVAALDGSVDLPAKLVAITFDDAFADFELNAIPVLLKHGFAATLYVTTGYIGGESAWLNRTPQDRRQMLTAQQLRSLPDAGIECGAHSHTHPELDRLPRKLLEREVVWPKHMLEELLERPVRSFAYPFGYYDRRVRAVVRDVGYRSACATGDVMGSPSADRLTLPRFIVKSRSTVDDLARLLDRPVSTIALQHTRTKEAVWRAMRRLERGDGGRRRAESAVPHPQPLGQ